MILVSATYLTSFSELILSFILTIAEGEGIEPPAAIIITANGFEVRKAHQSLSASTRDYNIKQDGV